MSTKKVVTGPQDPKPDFKQADVGTLTKSEADARRHIEHLQKPFCIYDRDKAVAAALNYGRPKSPSH